MWTDGSPKNNPIGEEGLTTRQNKNIIITDEFGSISNDRGFELFSNSFNSLGNQPIGKIVIDNNRVVIFSIDSNNLSEIGVIDNNGIYTEIIKETVGNKFLNFSSHYPIHGEYIINNKNEVVISWVDGFNTPKTLNLETLFSSPEELDLFNKAQSPIILNSSIEVGGSLLTGAYFPIFRLVRNDNSTSKWFYDYLPFFVNDDSPSVGLNQFDGAKSGTNSNKSLNIDLMIFDEGYNKIEVGYIYQKEGIKTAHSYKKYNITNLDTVHTSTITGESYTGKFVNIKIENSTSVEIIDLAEIIIENSTYETAKLIMQDNNRLYLGDLTSYKEPDNLQQYVNNLILMWRSESYLQTFITGTDKHHTKNNHKKGFAHGEVYSFYLRFQWKWGWGKWHVMNGRLPEPPELNTITDPVSGESDLRYRLEDTAIILNSGSNYAEGHFGFWENEDEEYPLDGGFPTGKVRHFVFPTMNLLRSQVYNDVFGNYGTITMDKLGVYITNINLSEIVDCEGNSPISYELGYAKRVGYNNRIQGQSPLLNRDGLNYNILYGWSGAPNNSNSTPKYKLYPFELLRNKSGLVSNKIRLEYKLKSDSFTLNQLSLVDHYGAAILERLVGFMDYMNGNSTVLYPNIIPVNLEYVPGNVKVSATDNNLFLEEYVRMNNNFNSFFNSLTTKPNINLFNFSTTSTEDYSQTYNGEETVLITLLNYKNNYYNEFDKQEIVNTGFILKDPNVKIFGGDTFICSYSSNTAFNYFNNKYTVDDTDGLSNNRKNGIIVARRLLVESQYNINFRHVDLDNTNGYTDYYPKSSLDKFALMERDKNINDFLNGYEIDYNAILDQWGEIFNNLNEDIENDPFKIIRSEEFTLEASVNNWRTFRQNDYYIIPKNRGKLINLVSARDWIYIHTEKCLFRTRSRNNYQFNSSGEEVFIGAGDIFASEPFPVIHSELGELGTQHKYSCLITKNGYVFIDSEKGKLFLINDKIIELSEKGLFDFFIKNSECIGDNPYLGNSIQSVWDDRFRRFIISLNYQKISQNNQNNFKGVWSNDPKFLNSLNIGDVVYYKGKYRKYNPQL